MSGSVSYTKDGAIATVVIENKGRLNALSLPMWRQLRTVFEELAHDREQTRCVVLRGASDAFASGADIAEFERERYDIASARAYGKAIHPALVAISECPHPVIAMIRGAASAADWRLPPAQISVLPLRARASAFLSIASALSWPTPS